MSKLNVGIVGAGNISGAYLKGCSLFPVLQVSTIADVDLGRAQAQADKFNVRASTPEALLDDPEIDIVVNITPPQFHAPISKRALEAGKHVYSEKPLAIDFASGQELVELAEAKGLYLGCAPDTFLGGGLQSCRKVIDEGLIGTPVAAQGFFVGSGPESWHPDPDFFYKRGAGPLFDIGPYLITSLIHLMGPMQSVMGAAQISFPERLITAKEKYGQSITVETPTHITGLLEFVEGGMASITTSFDVPGHRLPHIEIYGSEATLSTPDPNGFAGPVMIKRKGAKEWQEVPLSYEYTENTRGLGVADMAHAIRSGRKARASGRQALHTLDVMELILESAQKGERLKLRSLAEKPAIFPTGLVKGELDD